MADDENNNDENSEAKPSFFAQHKKLIALALMALVLIGVSVGGTLAIIGLFNREEAPVEEVSDVDANAPVLPPKAIYYPIKPPIMVSFEGRGRQRLMQADITVLTRENDVIGAMENHMPMIRNALVMLMSGQTYEEMQTAEGKELMRVQCLQELQRILQQEIGKPGVEEVLFTSIIVQ